MRQAYQFQQAALDWAKARNRVAFFMEMRLCKTLIAIRWAEQKSLEKILVACPLPVTYVWQDELFLENISSTLLIGGWKHKLKLLEEQDTRWYITNYEALFVHQNKRAIPSIITRCHWQCVILDESTYIRNPKAIRTKTARRGFSSVPNKAILTGLPNPESAMDYYEQMAFLNGEFLGCKNFWEFRHRYFHQGWNDWDWIPNKGTISKIKNAVHENAFELSRKEAGVGSRKIFEIRYVFLPPKIRAAYNRLEEDFEIGDETTKWTFAVRTWLTRFAGGQPDQAEYCSDHKLNELINLLLGELKKEQVIVWFRFNKELFHVMAMLSAKGISVDIVVGALSSFQRNEVRKNFENGKFRCLLMQVKCGKFGIGCSAASAAIYYSNSLEFEERQQSEDRIIDPEKKEPVLIIDLLTKHTVDEDVHKALKWKRMNSKMFMSRIVENLKKRRQISKEKRLC